MRHSPCQQLSGLGEPKCLYEEKLSCLTGLPLLPRQDNATTQLSCPLRQAHNHHVNGWLNFAKK